METNPFKPALIGWAAKKVSTNNGNDGTKSDADTWKYNKGYTREPRVGVMSMISSTNAFARQMGH